MAEEAVVIRPATVADAPALERIHLQARRAALPGLREPHPEGSYTPVLVRAMADRSRRVLVAAGPDGAPVAYIAFGHSEPHGPMVSDLCVLPGRQCRGLGTRLLRAAMGWSDRPALFCFARNHGACAFYERHGFRVVARGDGSGNEEGEPDLLYAWSAAAAPAATDPEGENP